ncbi:MAG: hypothetical protein GWN01_11950 [Nitrosopumilaceae archaeon]|nr:hypothetical protein [Nitrosopumilaceae archaeon]NIU01589.1 hypothetical protein [Nitrosopumilaceae archaeon]NIU88008.1 hypothetical protein [Nitrosopumilaceae archaeon]NIV66275.1 hypothetical protein [Nitrosopumilaceae archaeon]NIX62191.1 hypothetical protein [Nitrosopumilaceae archaeon]
MAKERITVSIDKEILKWIDSKIDDSVFANRSHCFEFAVKQMMKDTK